jgi:hypothetical protein
MHQWDVGKNRIVEQIERRKERRKETLPFDRNLDLDTNAKINVKKRWKSKASGTTMDRLP